MSAAYGQLFANRLGVREQPSKIRSLLGAMLSAWFRSLLLAKPAEQSEFNGLARASQGAVAILGTVSQNVKCLHANSPNRLSRRHALELGIPSRVCSIRRVVDHG